jgi:PBP1b-binding outer membrane lipoprotein LpoB
MKTVCALAMVASAVVLLTGCSQGTGKITAPNVATPTHVTSATTVSTSAQVVPSVPSERIGKAFVNHGFQITVTKVVHLRELPVDAESASGGVKPYVPLNGQFVVVYVTAKNVGKSPDTVSDTSSTLLDRAGNSYD